MDKAAGGLAGLLDSGALRVKLPSSAASEGSSRVRFLPASTFARDFGLPPGCTGEVRDRWMRGGVELLGVLVDGVGYLSGVPAQEVETLLEPPT